MFPRVRKTIMNASMFAHVAREVLSSDLLIQKDKGDLLDMLEAIIQPNLKVSELYQSACEAKLEAFLSSKKDDLVEDRNKLTEKCEKFKEEKKKLIQNSGALTKKEYETKLDSLGSSIIDAHNKIDEQNLAIKAVELTLLTIVNPAECKRLVKACLSKQSRSTVPPILQDYIKAIHHEDFKTKLIPKLQKTSRKQAESLVKKVVSAELTAVNIIYQGLGRSLITMAGCSGRKIAGRFGLSHFMIKILIPLLDVIKQPIASFFAEDGEIMTGFSHGVAVVFAALCWHKETDEIKQLFKSVVKPMGFNNREFFNEVKKQLNDHAAKEMNDKKNGETCCNTLLASLTQLRKLMAKQPKHTSDELSPLMVEFSRSEKLLNVISRGYRGYVFTHEFKDGVSWFVSLAFGLVCFFFANSSCLEDVDFFSWSSLSMAYPLYVLPALLAVEQMVSFGVAGERSRLDKSFLDYLRKLIPVTEQGGLGAVNPGASFR